jgi:hypothetical protein
MKKVCAWCKIVMDPGTAGDPRVSHGMCDDCRIKVKAELAALAAEKTTQTETEARI